MIATLPRSAPVEVRSSVAGYAQSCYSVTAAVDGKSVRGYVQGNSLEAVAEFERDRAARDAALVAAPAAASAESAAPAKAIVPAVERTHYPPFPNFSATDMKKRPMSVHGMKGKVNLICFWAPTDKSSFVELLNALRVSSQFKQQVDVLGVALSSDRRVIADITDDLPGLRIVPGGVDIAARLNIDFDNIPRTYVLNDRFEIVASGLHGKALEEAVKKLVAEQ